MSHDPRQQLVISLIPYFKKQWRFDHIAFEQHETLRLIGDSGKALSFVSPYNKNGFLKVSCEWPNLDGAYTSPRNWGVSERPEHSFRIGFSTHRPPSHIAQDIERRLLVSYDVIYQQCEQAKAVTLAEREITRQRTDLLKQVGNMRDMYRGRDPDRSRLIGCGNLTAEVTLGRGGDVEMYFRSLPYDTAVRIASLINTEHPKITPT